MQSIGGPAIIMSRRQVLALGICARSPDEPQKRNASWVGIVYSEGAVHASGYACGAYTSLLDNTEERRYLSESSIVPLAGLRCTSRRHPL